jgi:RHS repeat-associated protein
VHNSFPTSGDSITFTRGNKLFELTNHLGNVLATIGDKRYGVTTDDSTVVYYNPELVSANDYYPFGMQQYARSWTEPNVGNYRFGYNGKEQDNEVKGAGDQIDYGMRVYDPRVGRFMSLDPFTKKYAELTPYQYASNGPVSGVDMDGLEYVTANYMVTIKNGKNAVTANYTWFNPSQHNIHGAFGLAVIYDITIRNLDKGTTTTNAYFVSRGANSTVSGITQYGNYMGSDPLPNFNAYSGKPIDNTYRYDVPSVDFVDQQAKLHDQGYDRVQSVGASGLFTDWGTTPYDEAAAQKWGDFLDKYPQGSTDPFNGMKLSLDERQAARRGLVLFNAVVAGKKEAISEFIMENYSSEAKSRYSFFSSVQEEADQFNYKLFLSKYMEKDVNGNWIRKDKMWNHDKDKNPTTPKTSN